jgi:hypothetical protein
MTKARRDIESSSKTHIHALPPPALAGNSNSTLDEPDFTPVDGVYEVPVERRRNTP